MADNNKVVAAGLVIYFQILVFYAIVYFGGIGSRPEGISDCFSYPGSKLAYTKNELKIQAQIEHEDIEDIVNMSQQFGMLVAFGFWIQLICFVTEVTQMFYKTKSDYEDDDTFREFKQGVNKYMIEREQKQRERNKIMNIILGLVRTGCLILHIVLAICLFTIRLSHGGQVCSGIYLNEEQKANKDVTQYYEITRGQFLKVVIVYYCVMAIGLVVALISKIKQDIDDELEMQKQEEFNQRAAALFEDKDIAMQFSDDEEKDSITAASPMLKSYHGRENSDMTEQNLIPQIITIEKRKRGKIVFNSSPQVIKEDD